MIEVRVIFDKRQRTDEVARCTRNDMGAAEVSDLIEWDTLRRKAMSVAANAYAPYSGLRVGAAGLAVDGRVFTGCNVENVSYGLGLCAECAVVCGLYAAGGGRLVALSCTDAAGNVLMPCGRCRQVLLEHGGGELLIDHPAGARPLSQLLPDAFGPDAWA